MTLNVGIYVYDNAEVLDFAGPFEVFSTAARMKSRKEPKAPKAFDVFLIADSQRLVSARSGFNVQPKYTITNHPDLDILIIPGGVHHIEINRPEILTWIANISTCTEITASVCSGAFILASAGLLQGQPATTHWEDLDELQLAFPDISVQPDVRWVDLGNIVTSAGVSAGIDMSLHLIARLEGLELARSTARQIDFPWDGA